MKGDERGRGERVLPGVWRLRMPLPWPGVPHVNAFAVAEHALANGFYIGCHPAMTDDDIAYVGEIAGPVLAAGA